MWHSMFAQQIPFPEKIIRTVVVYLLVAVLIRLTGKRGLAGLNNLDVVVMILLSNVVQNAIIGNDLSVTGGAIGAVTLVVADAVLNRLSLASSTFNRLFDGTETEVVRDGTLQTRVVRRLGLRSGELERAVRQQNGDDLRQVRTATLEPGGQLLVTLKPAEQGATKADVDALKAQLRRIETALAASRS